MGGPVWKNIRLQESLDLERFLREKGMPVPDELLSNNYTKERYPAKVVLYAHTGEPLGSVFEKFSPAMRLRIVINFAKLVAEMHNLGIGHHDLHSNNIVIDPKTKKITILDADSFWKFPNTREAWKVANGILNVDLSSIFRGNDIIFYHYGEKLGYTYAMAFFVTYMHHYVGHNSLGPQIKKIIRARLEQYIKDRFPTYWPKP